MRTAELCGAIRADTLLMTEIKSMEHLWTPWRFRYIVGAEKPTGCVFCVLPAEKEDSKNLILYRGKFCFVILNLFPYNTAHLMIVPYLHESVLADLDDDTSNEMMSLAKFCQRSIATEYNPDGFNAGLNLGKCAGAGIAEHLHMHVVPRWIGDANFMSVIGETRLIPEELSETYTRLAKYFTP